MLDIHHQLQQAKAGHVHLMLAKSAFEPVALACDSSTGEDAINALIDDVIPGIRVFVAELTKQCEAEAEREYLGDDRRAE